MHDGTSINLKQALSIKNNINHSQGSLKIPNNQNLKTSCRELMAAFFIYGIGKHPKLRQHSLECQIPYRQEKYFLSLL